MVPLKVSFLGIHLKSPILAPHRIVPILPQLNLLLHLQNMHSSQIFEVGLGNSTTVWYYRQSGQLS